MIYLYNTVEDNTIIIRCDPLEKRPEHDKELHQYIIQSLLNGKKLFITQYLQ